MLRATISPPTMNVGSSPAPWSAVTARAVEVVFPWVPANPIAGVAAVRASSNDGLGHTATPPARAATSSGSVAGTAEENTTRSAPAIRSGRWPTQVSIPRSPRASSIVPGLRSEPVTR